MDPEQKYKVFIDTIKSDAPHGHINFVTLSFITPQNVPKTKYVDIRGFKIYGGYNNEELAKDAGRKIKAANPNHNVFVAQLGQLYDWDNVNNTDEIDYDDPKQNAIEKNRRADADKTRLIKQQYANEIQHAHQSQQSSRKRQINAKLAKKLHDKGLLTRSETEREANRQIERSTKNSQEEQAKEDCQKEMDEAMDEMYKTDYLDVDQGSSLKYGCISFYSPKRIGGLKQLCFKVRCICENQDQLQKRIQALKKSTPNEPLAIFEVGKWHPYHETVDNLTEDALKQLNYCMYHYIESIKIEAQEFEARKEAEMKKAAEKNAETKAKTSDSIEGETSVSTKLVDRFMETLKPQQQVAINDLMAYLDDPELRNRTKVMGYSDQVVIDV
jgi:hypothetical protein